MDRRRGIRGDQRDFGRSNRNRCGNGLRCSRQCRVCEDARRQLKHDDRREWRDGANAAREQSHRRGRASQSRNSHQSSAANISGRRVEALEEECSCYRSAMQCIRIVTSRVVSHLSMIIISSERLIAVPLSLRDFMQDNGMFLETNVKTVPRSSGYTYHLFSLARLMHVRCMRLQLCNNTWSTTSQARVSHAYCI